MAVDSVKSSTDLRLAELMAAISLATDIADGYPLEKSLRDALLAVGLARELGLQGQDLSDVYYTALLAHLGCTAQSFDLAAGFGGDDIGIRRVNLTGDPQLVRKAFRERAKQLSPLEVTAIMVRIAVGGRRLFQANTDATCEAADRLATRLCMSTGVRRALSHVYTRWDGKGFPRTSGEAIPLPARITALAFLAVAYDLFGGRPAALAMVQQRSGAGIDPSVARAFLRNADDLLGQVEAESVWDTALAAEPEPRPWLPESRLDQVARAFADFVDLKSPYTLSHSTGVARIAEDAVRSMGRGEEAAINVRRAGLLHDLGRVSVPNGIWDKRGPLTGADWERVRMHPYYSERILAHSPMLQPLAEVAGMHHERLDGSGYHRGAQPGSISAAARVLEASDAYQAMTEDRPHRAALPPSEAAEQLSQEARTGRLDHEAVEAVLEAVGQARPHDRQAWPAGLSDREVEVLRLLARGQREKEIGRALFISTNTVHHHVKQIYEKAGVSTRAGAALFAMEHDLILR